MQCIWDLEPDLLGEVVGVNAYHSDATVLSPVLWLVSGSDTEGCRARGIATVLSST